MITVERSRTRARSLATALVVAATCCAVVTIAIPRRAGAQEPVTLLAASAERGVVLRWAWGDGERPIGWLVDRRAAGSGWLRLTPQPVTRVRDRAVARARLGERFARFEGILFSDDPRAELADPESYRSLQLLSADVDPDVARLLGLRYDDSSATTGVRYEYRLVVLVGGAERVAATSGMVEAGRYTPPAAPDSLRVAQGRRGLSLRWSPRGAFTAYHVYRGTRADGRDATRLNATPVVVFLNDDGVPTEAAATFFTDTTVRADTAYYQVAGIDAFGRVSRRSPALAGIVRDLMAPGAPTVHQARVAADTVLLTWDAPSDADLAGFQVWRADSSAGPFQRLGVRLPVQARGYRDAGRPSRRISWYRVTAIDSAGHEGDPSALTMVEVPDFVAPPVPTGLAGLADTGRISLHWGRVRAPDLRGYRVYRSSIATGTFAMLTDSLRRDTLLVDRIPAAADHAFFYRVTAVDSAFNESAPSTTVAVRPPDATPPTAPRLTAVRRGERTLDLEWIPNVEPDVVGYRLQYRPAGDPRWTQLPTLIPSARRTGSIGGLEAGRRYDVALVAVDDAGNASLPSPMLSGAPLSPTTAAPELRRARFDASSGSVRLEWDEPRAGVVELLILRREGSGTYRVIGAAAAGTTTFVDATTRPGRRYEYALRSRDGSGTLIDSRARSVTIPELPR